MRILFIPLHLDLSNQATLAWQPCLIKPHPAKSRASLVHKARKNARAIFHFLMSSLYGE